MFKKNLLTVFLSVLLFSAIAKADAAPEPGYMQVSPSLVFELSEDFSEYRFFLDSIADIDEIEVKKGETITLDGTNRGGSKRVATLVAILKSELEKSGITGVIKDRNADAVKLKEFTRNKQNPAVVRLIDHAFYTHIPVSKRAGWSYPGFRIERDGTVLKAVKTGDISPKLSFAEEREIKNAGFGTVTVAAGILLGLAIVATGVFTFRKVLKKRLE